MAEKIRLLIPNPATPTSQLDYVVPTLVDGAWKLESICAQLETDATVGTRLWSISVKDADANLIAEWAAPQTQSAGQQLTYSWLRGMSLAAPTATGPVGTVNAPCPEIQLQRDDVITIYEVAGVSTTDLITQVMIVLSKI